MSQEIPLPQSVKLYKVEDVTPPLSVDSIESTSSSGSFNNISSDTYYYKLYSVNRQNLRLTFDEKNVSCTRSPSYYSIDGFTNGVECRFINTESPTVSFAPLIKAQDKNVNVPLFTVATNTYTVDNYTNYLSNTLNIYDLVLLKNQTNNSENVIYRVQNINGLTLTLYNDILDTSSINYLLSQNQNTIFTRVKVTDSVGDYYYGLDNTSGYKWISQAKGIHLEDVDFGISLNQELSCNELPYSLFSGTNIKKGDKFAVNVLTNGSGSLGGKTTGIYYVSSISEGIVYLSPIYPSYVFVHQFTRVKYNISTNEKDIWYVNPQALNGTNYLYNTVNFNFLSYNISSIINAPNSWGLQVGSANDTVLGFSIFTSKTYNKFITLTDKFKMAIKSPTWSEGEIRGLDLNLTSD